jgi:hypothetical protein
VVLAATDLVLYLAEAHGAISVSYRLTVTDHFWLRSSANKGEIPITWTTPGLFGSGPRPPEIDHAAGERAGPSGTIDRSRANTMIRWAAL